MPFVVKIKANCLYFIKELISNANNELIKTEVSFSFRYWETLDITRQKPSLGDKIFDTIVNTVQRNIERNLPQVITKLL